MSGSVYRTVASEKGATGICELCGASFHLEGRNKGEVVQKILFKHLKIEHEIDWGN